METYITISKVDRQQEFVVWLRKLEQGLCINLQGQDGEGVSEGREYMYTYDWFMLRFDRKQQNSVKQLSFHLKKYFVFEKKAITPQLKINFKINNKKFLIFYSL